MTLCSLVERHCSGGSDTSMLVTEDSLSHFFSKSQPAG